MLNLEVQTGLSQEEVTDRIRKFFGKGGLGLSITEDSPPCLTFEGGGGYVSASICAEGPKTKVRLVTQEWEHQIKEFASTLK